MKKKNRNNWFAEWFDSKYYHLLYDHRDFSEAESFIQRLFTYLKLNPKNTKVLDLACGKGRHALQVHQLGYAVTGIDLSTESIAHAKQFEEAGLTFQVGDMRSLGYREEVDLVLNLFTSFGYFKKEGENQKAIQSMARALKPNGILVLDYLNVKPVEERLPTEEKIKKGGVEFLIDKYIESGFIVKDIAFEDKGVQSLHSEFVKLIGLADFKAYTEEAGLEIKQVFGDYHLNPFQEGSSDRLILIAQKHAK
ncbi:MAG: class I SAM-dependent methyltransferase [Vicingaceae bacterium]